MLLKATGSKEMIVTDVSMRDGILWDLVYSAADHQAAHLYKEVIQSAQTVGQKYLHGHDPRPAHPPAGRASL